MPAPRYIDGRPLPETRYEATDSKRTGYWKIEVDVKRIAANLPRKP